MSWIVRKLLQQYWRWSRPLTLGAMGIVVDGEGRVLLLRHTYVTGGWTFPGGGVERRETLEAALARELDEEAGIAVTGPTQLLGVYATPDYFSGNHVAVFVVRSWRTLRPLAPNAEIAELNFFSIDGLPVDISSGAKLCLEEMTGQAPRRALW